MPEYIPVAQPDLSGNEREYVLDCIDSGWISSNGKYIKQFESAFASFVGVKHALGCSNGTVALHLALLALGVQPGDEVIVPTLTYIATANAVTYCGAKPVFVDSEDVTWNMDPTRVEELVTERTRGIIAVHIYGHPVDMDALRAIADRHGLFIVEDAAEAHGAKYKGRNVGALSEISTFSFFGNKIITTGEGGMVCTDDPILARRMLQLKGQGQDLERRYWFTMVGYNYRMTNVAAAIGLAQVERAGWLVARRREIAQAYRSCLAGVPDVVFSPEMPWAQSVFWLSCVVLSDTIDRDAVMAAMLAEGVETRPFFYPMHTLPIYAHLAAPGGYSVAERLGRQGINLPTYSSLTEEQVARVSEALVRAIERCERRSE